MQRVGVVLCAVLLALSSAGCKDFFYYSSWFWGADEHHPAPSDPDIADLLDSHRVRVEEELTSEHEGYRRFKITFTQRMDHDDVASPMFEQHIILHHRDVNAPMVLATTGYNNPSDDFEYLTEPAKLLSANQIMVEHRYFPPSIPDDADWTKLNIEQSAIDFHNITSFFRLIYRGKWLSTGTSKGGMTAVFHRRFFPDDVDATVGYVTPISLGAPDRRYESFLASINPEGCGDDVRALQVRFIRDRAAIAERLRTDLGFADVPAEQAELFSVSVAFGFDWSYWQHFGVQYCGFTRASLSDDLYAARWLAAFAQMGGGADMSAYSFQAATELGYQSISYEHLLEAYAEVSWPEPDPNRPEPPPPAWGDTPLTYRPEVMLDVIEWVQRDAERLLLVYGEFDPWSGGAIELGAASDSYRLVAPQASHGANIAQLADADRELALDKLYGWANVERPAVPALGGAVQALVASDGIPTPDRELLLSALPVEPLVAPPQ
jgi:hypothetical protein